MIKASLTIFIFALCGCKSPSVTSIYPCKNPLEVIGLDEPRAPGYGVVFHSSEKDANDIAENLSNAYDFFIKSVYPDHSQGRALLIETEPGSDIFYVEPVDYGLAATLFTEGLTDEMLEHMLCDPRIYEIAANNYIFLED